MATIGDTIARVRNVLKSVKEDAFMTDRFIYSLVMKYARTLMERDSKLTNLFKNSTLFKQIPCIELIDVDRVEACCIGVETGCTFKRSKNPLPKITALRYGLMIRAVTTIDYSEQLYKTEPSVYANMTKTSGFKYNKNKYFWVIDNYLYIPEVEWEAVRLQAMFEDNLDPYLCHLDSDICRAEQDRDISIPEHLFTEIENFVRQEILTAGQIPSDGADDSQNIMR